MKKVFLTPEGWLVTDVRGFRWFFDYQPPRPNAYLVQLAEDATSWKPLALWATGIGLFTVAASLGLWFLIPPGLATLGLWLWAFLRTVPDIRDSPLLEATIGELDRHPLLRDHLAGPCWLKDGRKIGVVVPKMLFDAVSRERGPVQVLLVYSPSSEYCFVIGARAMVERNVSFTR